MEAAFKNVEPEKDPSEFLLQVVRMEEARVCVASLKAFDKAVQESTKQAPSLVKDMSQDQDWKDKEAKQLAAGREVMQVCGVLQKACRKLVDSKELRKDVVKAAAKPVPRQSKAMGKDLLSWINKRL